MSSYDIKHEVPYGSGSYKVFDTLTKPYFIAGGDTPNYVKKHFKLPQKYVPKRVWPLWAGQQFWLACGFFLGEGEEGVIAIGHPVYYIVLSLQYQILQNF